jgi:hypothetical protein
MSLPASSLNQEAGNEVNWDSLNALAIPQSWNVQDKSAEFQDTLNNVVKDIRRKDPDPESTHPTMDQKTSKLVGELDAVISSGGVMVMKSAVGKKFYDELNEDPTLKEEYKSLKTHKQMKTFRQAYAMRKKTSLLERITAKTEEVFDLSRVDAEYCSFPRIVQREGNDVAAYATAEFYVKSATERYSAGKSFNGHPYVKWDPMRNMAMVLHHRENLSSGMRNSWMIQDRMKDNGSSGNSETTLEKHVATNVAEPEPAPTPKKGAKRGADDPIQSPTGASKNEDSNKKGKLDKAGEINDKKRVQVALLELQKLKKEHDVRVQAAHDLLSVVSKDPAWRWCNNEILLEPVRTALSAVDENKKANPFWRRWVLESNFAAVAKKQFSIEVIVSENDGIGEIFKKDLEKLAAATDTLKRMQSQRSA